LGQQAGVFAPELNGHPRDITYPEIRPANRLDGDDEDDLEETSDWL
jgi:hypothetical protein